MAFITQQHKLFFQTLSSTICHPGDVPMVYESFINLGWELVFMAIMVIVIFDRRVSVAKVTHSF